MYFFCIHKSKKNKKMGDTINHTYGTSYGKTPQLLFNDFLGAFSVGLPTSKYSYFSSGGNDGDDAVVTYDTIGRFLDVNSGVGSGGFTKVWTPAIPDAIGGLDHVKYLVYKNGAYPLKPDGSEVVYEVCMSLEQQIGTIPPAIYPNVSNPKSDIRLCGGAMNMIDYESWMIFDLFLSDETVYAFYERLPFGKPSFGGPGPDYHAFSHAIPIGKRNRTDPSLDFDTYAIGINRQKGYVRYFINGAEVLRITQIGMPIDRTYRLLDHGGPPGLVDLKQINVGFGTFSLLDMLNPVSDVSLPQFMSTYAFGAIEPNQPKFPLVQLGLDPQYVDPTRVTTTTGDDLAIGAAPSVPTLLSPFVFAVPADAGTSTRLFGNGARLRLKWLNVYGYRPQ